MDKDIKCTLYWYHVCMIFISLISDIVISFIETLEMYKRGVKL